LEWTEKRQKDGYLCLSIFSGGFVGMETVGSPIPAERSFQPQKKRQKMETKLICLKETDVK
jgi:hypothetical protein